MPLNVFYLDDEPDLLEIFYDIFNSPQIKVSTFTSVQDAVLAIENSPPDLLFIDYRLPGTTGDEVALRLPVSITKALVTGEMQQKTKAHFTKVFTKPFNLKEVDTFIKSYLTKAHTA